jgi:putative hydrolase of the HAD superfamily
VVFDIYGTLLISASGDIDKLKLSPACVLNSFACCGIDILSSKPDESAEYIITRYKETIKQLKAKARNGNIEYPEINIREVWQLLLKSLHAEKLINKGSIKEVDLLALHFEILSNPVYPMPFMGAVIHSLRRHGMPLGIVSNAQFYTPLIMNYFLDTEIGSNGDIKYFEPEMSVYSYKERISKPSTVLFEKLLAGARKHKLKNHEILFVGNDMLKDIYPAQQLGIRTALFAGDARSLRLRPEDPRLASVVPDHTINTLEQITEIVL